MQPFIKNITSKKLIGKRLSMSFADNQTISLWRGFMPQRKLIQNPINTDLISMQVYPSGFDFDIFDPNAGFEKWAAVEVSDFDAVPDGMETFNLAGGLYAVFIHKGPASQGEQTFGYIFRVWLPASEFVLDERPHFEILGDKYKNDEPDSEEEIWIPIKRK